MVPVSALITDFKAKPISEKINFFSDGLSSLLDQLDEYGAYSFFNAIVTDPDENTYVRKSAISTLTDAVFLSKVKARHVLNTLLDNWNGENHPSLQLQRIKDLFYLVDHEKDAIRQIYIGYLTNEEAEISAEASFHLGLLELQNALISSSEELLLKHCGEAHYYFSASNSVIENRVDSRFFLALVGILTINKGLSGTLEIIAQRRDELAELLSQRIFFSSSDLVNSFYVSLFRSAVGYSKVLEMGNPSNWLDFRHSLSQVFEAYCEIQNLDLKDRLQKGSLHWLFSQAISQRFIEPFFAINYKAELNRLDFRLSELAADSDEARFLMNLKSGLREEIGKKKHHTDALKSTLRSITGNNEANVNVAFSKIANPEDAAQVLQAYFELVSPSSENFLNQLIAAAIKLQGNKMYAGATSEDARNTYIADLLEATGYRIKDQTRWGSSAGGKQPGEIDIFVSDVSNRPITIIEALNLTALDQAYLALHINKLFNYDTTGLPFNVILVYYHAPSFVAFETKYKDYLGRHTYKYVLNSLEAVPDFPYSDVKILRAKHNREGTDVELLHVLVNMP